MQSGIISRIYGSYYDIIALPQLKQEFRGKLRGKLRLTKNSPKHKKQRHLLIIGDEVLFTTAEQKSPAEEPTAQEGCRTVEEAIIQELKERQNCIERAQGYEVQALGANLDRAILLVSLTSPQPHFDFIDRFLCSAYVGNVNPCLVFSKIDLISKREWRKLAPMIKLYKNLNYTVYLLNLLNRRKLKPLRRRFKGERVLLTGQSGTGKSTLMNGIFGEELQRTAYISSTTKQGRHTTSNSRLLVYPSERSLWIDTPGIKEWGIQHLDYKTILNSFPEIRAYIDRCRFSDCKHEVRSEGCEVIQFLERSRQQNSNPPAEKKKQVKDALHPSRLRSLDNMLASIGCLHLSTERIEATVGKQNRRR